MENNLLLIAPISKLTNKATESFLNKHYSDDNFLIYIMEEECDFNPRINKKNCIKIDKHSFYNWQDLPEYDLFPPVDNTIWKMMSQYEGLAYKMMEGYFPIVENSGERQRIYLRTVKYFNAILQKNKITTLIEYGIPHQVYDFVLYALCKCKGIKTVMFYRSPIRGYIYTFTDIEKHIPLETKHIKYTEDDLNEDYRANYNVYVKEKKNAELYYMPTNNLRGKIGVLRNRYTALKEYNMTFSDYILLFKMRNIRKKANKLISRKAVSPDYTKKYIYVGLHYQPEGTTAPLAGRFVNQELMVQYLSYCVPDDVIIYVKEHPNQKLRGEKNADFFEEISKMRNVYLVPTETSSEQLMLNSIAVATCTGTVSYEAMFRKKPALMFGYSLYNYRPGAFTIKTIEDCKNAIRNICMGVQISDDSIIEYMYNIQNITRKAEFAVQEKEFMLKEGVTMEENNAIIESMLENAVI